MKAGLHNLHFGPSTHDSVHKTELSAGFKCIQDTVGFCPSTPTPRLSAAAEADVGLTAELDLRVLCPEIPSAINLVHLGHSSDFIAKHAFVSFTFFFVLNMDTVVDIDPTNDASKALDLSRIRFQLIRLEDTIIFHLIERVQFALSKVLFTVKRGLHGLTIYTPGAVKIPNSELSFFDWYFFEQEKLQSLIRRYESPDEYPFFPDAVQTPILKPLNYPKILHTNDVNVNDKIKTFYIEKFLPAVCPSREDRGESQENYGSAATTDFACLQALSRRIHYGKFVAESKFQSEPDKYERLIRACDRQGIAESITNKAVEKSVLARLRLKALTYGKDPSISDGADEHIKINVDAVVAMYEDFVIPLTKEVEVEYLMQRLDD